MTFLLDKNVKNVKFHAVPPVPVGTVLTLTVQVPLLSLPKSFTLRVKLSLFLSMDIRNK